MIYHKDRPGTFKIFDKIEMKFLDQTWESNDFLMAHHINSYEKPENPDIICLDVIESTNDYVNEFFIKNLNQTGKDLLDFSASVLPFGAVCKAYITRLKRFDQDFAEKNYQLVVIINLSLLLDRSDLNRQLLIKTAKNI